MLHVPIFMTDKNVKDLIFTKIDEVEKLFTENIFQDERSKEFKLILQEAKNLLDDITSAKLPIEHKVEIVDRIEWLDQWWLTDSNGDTWVECKLCLTSWDGCAQHKCDADL